MTDKNKALLVAILDRSGSMETIKEDTEGGFNTFIKEQRKVKGQKTLVTLTQFDTTYELVYSNVPASEVPDLELVPRGGTALYDAIGRTITQVGADLAKLSEDERPGSVTLLILTDGGENSSREFHGHVIKQMIEDQQSKYEWRFIFMGSNQDAVLVGRGLGIDAHSALTYTGANVAQAFASASNHTTQYRLARSAGTSYADSVALASFTEDDRTNATS